MQKKISTNKVISSTDVIILCGGEGTRLKKVVKECPKPMAEINGRPFLDYLISYVLQFGVRRIILCTGYKSDFIKNYYGRKKLKHEIIFSNENIPLGTAGAVKNAEDKVKSDFFIVMNGDSFCAINLVDLLKYHLAKNAVITVAVVNNRSTGDYGSIVLDRNNRVIQFREKTTKGSGLVNAGVYVFDKSILSHILKDSKCSIEKDLFPEFSSNDFYGFIINKRLIDIGTPERYEHAKKYFSKDKTSNYEIC